jgi:ABC-type multidrug transport system fused ATPase/permease subunit
VKEGRLVESGPHQLLSQKQNGEYKKLLDMQKEMNESFINA